MFSGSGAASGRPLAVDAAILLLRLWFGLVMAFGHGLSKLGDLSAFIASVERRGIPFPGFSAPVAAVCEFAGGLLLAIGCCTRPASAAMFLTMLVAAFGAHAADPFAKKELALAYLVVALAIAISGPGRYSIDAWWRSRRAASR